MRLELPIRKFLGDTIRGASGAKAYPRLRSSLQAEHSYLRNVCGIIQIGANSGQERDLYRAFDLDVIWIEPIPEVFQALQQNISGFAKQRAYNLLVAAEDGVEFQLHIASNERASSSIFDFSKHSDMFPPPIFYKDVIFVKGTTLKSISAAERVDIRSFDAIVLDTQGSELSILKGAKELLPKFRFVRVEVPDFESYKGCSQIGELSTFMLSCGFRKRNRHPIIQAAGIGTYFGVIYERTRR